MSYTSNFSRSIHPSTSTRYTGYGGSDSLSHSTVSGLSNNSGSRLNMNPHSDETPERRRSPLYLTTNYGSYVGKDNYGTAEPHVQQGFSVPGTAHRFQGDSSETNLQASPPASNLEHVESKQLEDPRSLIRKLLDCIQDLHDIDIEKCLQDYKAMMEFKDPTALTKEEEYARSKRSPTEVERRTESRYRRERDQFRNERDQLQKEVDELHAKVAALEKMEKENRPVKASDKEIEKIKKEYEGKIRKQIDEWKKILEEKNAQEMEKETKYNEDIKNLTMQLKAKEEMESKLTEKVEKYKSALKQSMDLADKLEKEKTDALTRLSKEMGNKLNDKNPNITDLSDSNRPTKIAEKYNELYDNEWTDALEYLSSEVYQEESAIKELLDLIQAAYSFCKDAAVHQMENLKKALTNVSSLPRDASVIDYSVDPQTEKMLEEIRKSQKMSADTLFKEFEYSKGFKPVYKKIPQYTVKCLELCWLMHMHNPPVVLGKSPSEGSVFDGSMYKEYTKTGFTIQYVVWLPLLLHENGALLQKGVAQPYPRDKSIRQRRTKAEDTNRGSHNVGRYQQPQEKEPTETNVDDLFNQPSKTHRSTTKSHLRESTPSTVSSSMSSDNYKYLYGNTGNYTTNINQQHPTSTTATGRVSLYPNPSSTAMPSTQTNPSITSTGNFRANYGSSVGDPYYSTPMWIHLGGRDYVKFQGQYYTMAQWSSLGSGSSEA